MSKTPKNLKLYNKIKERMRREHKRSGQRWGAYSSGRLVSEYLRRGGTYPNKKSTKSRGLARWYKEKWVDVCHWPKKVSCGRSKFSTKKFPYCRPSKRITSKTPKTVEEMSESQRKNLCKKKRRSPKKVMRSVKHSFREKRNIRLKSIKKSPKENKKLRATFEVNGKEKHTDFGAKGMSDYTKHKDKDRRSRYITRHKKDLRTGDPTRAGYLSMYVLWNKSSLDPSIADYKKRLRKYNTTGKFPSLIK
jgi:hypothetical protein